MTQDYPALSIGMVLFPNLTQLDLTGPYEVFSRLPNARVYLLAHTLDPIRSERGLAILPDTRFDEAPQMDILFVPGGFGINAAMEDPVMLQFLQAQARHARYVTSVCTGALVLAAAGLLEGYKATTHWLSIDLLPLFGIEAVAERVVIDGNRITGGGVTAGIDFAFVVAAEIYGEPVAKNIQLTIEYDPQPPFQSGSPRVAEPALVQAATESRAAAQKTRREISERAAANLRHAKI